MGLFSPAYFQFSSVQFNSIQFSSVQFSSVPFNSVQFSSIQTSSVQLLTILLLSHITIHFSSIQFRSVQFSSVQLFYAEENKPVILIFYNMFNCTIKYITKTEKRSKNLEREKLKKEGNLKRENDKIIKVGIVTTYKTSIKYTLISMHRIHTSFFYIFSGCHCLYVF